MKFGQNTPHSLYVPSVRTMPKRLKHYDYPYHFEVRRASRNSGIRWKARWLQASVTLAEEYIDFEEVEDGMHDVYFRDLFVGRFVERTMKIEDVIRRVPIRQTIVECGNPKTRRKVSPVCLE
ncbi:MAG: hypothetical protein JW884_02310 [Deltaproteobacteria bacterium]|nr:hypothetical protein [Deltaproteobacteria bacterium]